MNQESIFALLFCFSVFAAAALAMLLRRERANSRKALDEAWRRQAAQAGDAEKRNRLTLRISSVVGSNLEQESILPRILDLLSRYFTDAELRLLAYRGNNSFAITLPQSSREEAIERPGFAEVFSRTGFIALDEESAALLRFQSGTRLFHYNLPIVQGDTYSGSLLLSSPAELSAPDQRFLADLVPSLAAALRNQTLTDRFGRAVDSRVRDHLMSLSGRAQGELREAGILFVDLVGFTAQAERLSPVEIVHFLNAFFTRCQSIVSARGGVINKFLGDGFMAIFNAPSPVPDFPRRVLEAGNGIIAAIPDFEILARQCGIEGFAVALGAEIGGVLAGTIGSSERLEYTLMGDVVNVASRLEGLTRFFGVRFLSGEALASAVPDWSFRGLGRIRPKGKSRALGIYEVLGPSGSVDPLILASATLFEKGLAAYQGRAFEASLELWSNLLPSAQDKALSWYRSQAAAYIKNPPPPEWDGTETFHTK
ncbi:MAG TPA: adenylate/guanylate cyclase domain-containing protein [Treponemataceae bacterium]|nr:adenylate/guanylate cyclase domain-containing protein [Treponemataceae bacterium]